MNNPEDDEWMADTTITFDLAQEGDNTTIMRFSHSGWMEESEMLDNINYNWGRFMYSLKMYAETGKGHPVTD